MPIKLCLIIKIACLGFSGQVYLLTSISFLFNWVLNYIPPFLFKNNNFKKLILKIFKGGRKVKEERPIRENDVFKVRK